MRTRVVIIERAPVAATSERYELAELELDEPQADKLLVHK